MRRNDDRLAKRGGGKEGEWRRGVGVGWGLGGRGRRGRGGGYSFC